MDSVGHMHKSLTLCSLFDGSGGFPLAASRVGITPVSCSEIEPFPILVTTTRFPDMTHLGDIAKINGCDIEPVDIITFGSPCQDLSVAGRRAGLSGERSGLFHQAVRVIREMRQATNGKYPRFAVWENVPGAFSSNKGNDFHQVLLELVSVVDEAAAADLPRASRWEPAGLLVGGRWSIAWRVLNAQYFGVPQRRRRIFLIADFDSQRAGQILFEPTSLRRDTEAGSHTRQTPPANPARGVNTTSNNSSGGVAPLLFDHHPHDARVTGPCIITSTVTARYGTGGGNTPLVAYGFNAIHTERQNPSGRYGYPTTISKTLDTSGITPACNQGGIAIVQPDVVSASKSDFFCRGNHNIAGSLLATDANEPPIVTDPQPVGYRVRRLTPLECARLQGFPDDWTDNLAITEPTQAQVDYWWQVWARWAVAAGLKKTKTRAQVKKWLANPVTDRALYKLWGNGIALPCAEMVLARIVSETADKP